MKPTWPTDTTKCYLGILIHPLDMLKIRNLTAQDVAFGASEFKKKNSIKPRKFQLQTNWLYNLKHVISMYLSSISFVI